MRLHSILVLLALLLSFVLASAGQFVAVLETKAGKQADLTLDELNYLTDELRAQALAVLPANQGYTVMTRESIQAFLPPDKTIEECEGDCLVSTGRNISADYVAQARISKVGTRLAISVDFFETKSAKLVGSFTDRGGDVDGLIDAIQQKSPGVFSKARDQVIPSPIAERPAPVASSPDEVGVVVTVELEDGPGIVQIDGKLACGNKKKCSQELSTGKHSMIVSREGYRDSSFAITVPQGNNRYTLALMKKAGVLTIRASDAQGGDAVEAEVIVDGLVVGRTPWSGSVAYTAKVIGLRANGYKEAYISERLADGQKKAVTVQMSQQPKQRKAPSGMVAIPSGCFNMGTRDGADDEKPVRQVCVNSFYMDQTEVTRAAFKVSQGHNPHENDGSCYVWNGDSWVQGNLSNSVLGEEQPLVCVDWNQAKNYCEIQGKRLPTEAEWEYAARAGSATKWNCGNNESCLDRIAWYNGNSKSQSHPVGQKQANAWGLYDMAGNVLEWTSDWYGMTYYVSRPGQDPQGPASGTYRVLRGGGFGSRPAGLRSAYRGSTSPGNRYHNLGFRCVSQ